MAELFGLYLTLWALSGAGVLVHEVDGPVQFVDLYGEERDAPGAFSCVPGQPPELWISAGADLEVLVHELAHAFDCLDDGALNGSPSHTPEARPAWASDYCWRSAAEWHACSVVHNATSFTGAPSPASAARLEPIRFAGSAPSARPAPSAPPAPPAAASNGAAAPCPLPVTEMATLLASGTGPTSAQAADAGRCLRD